MVLMAIFQVKWVSVLPPSLGGLKQTFL